MKNRSSWTKCHLQDTLHPILRRLPPNSVRLKNNIEATIWWHQETQMLYRRIKGSSSGSISGLKTSWVPSWDSSLRRLTNGGKATTLSLKWRAPAPPSPIKIWCRIRWIYQCKCLLSTPTGPTYTNPSSTKASTKTTWQSWCRAIESYQAGEAHLQSDMAKELQRTTTRSKIPKSASSTYKTRIGSSNSSKHRLYQVYKKRAVNSCWSTMPTMQLVPAFIWSFSGSLHVAPKSKNASSRDC